MSEPLSEGRLRLLLLHADDVRQSVLAVGETFDAGGEPADAALANMRKLGHQVRTVLHDLATQSTRDYRAAEAGATLCCTAVRISGAVFTPEERSAWLSAFESRTNEFRDRDLCGKLLGNLANALAESGQLDEAEAVCRRRLQFAIASNNVATVALAKEHLGKVLLRRGQFRVADQLLLDAFDVARELGDQNAITRLLKDAADAMLRRGDSCNTPSTPKSNCAGSHRVGSAFG